MTSKFEPVMYMTSIIRLEDDMSWTALDYSGPEAARKTFRIKFNGEEMSNDFKDVFAQGKV